ncbi:MAG: hypothetical protein ACJ8FY_21945 [Gemmataceae bacterium]
MCYRVCFVAFSLFLLAGCNAKLNEEMKKELAFGEDWEFIIDGGRYKQKVKIEVDSSGAPVSVNVFLAKDRDNVMAALFSSKSSDLILASEQKTERATLEASAPAKEDLIIRIKNAGDKKANVSVKITN